MSWLNAEQGLLIVFCLFGVWVLTLAMYRPLRKRLRLMEEHNRELMETLRLKDIQYARIMVDRQKRSGFYANLVDKFPYRISEMIAQEDPRKLSGIIIDTIVELFDATEAVFFSHVLDQRELVLADAYGISSSKLGKRYEFGKGRPGIVATKGITMTTQDFLNESASIKRRIHEYESSECQMDILSPLIKDGDLLGIIGMRRIAQEVTKEEKLVFRMIADMASNAIAFSYLIAQYKRMAHRDGLTGLINRKAFMMMFADMLMSASIACEPLSVFMFDLDNFKAYNDRNGHLEGDTLLKELATLIGKSIRKNDIAARYGGEEFIIVFPNLPRQKAFNVAEFLRKKIERHPFAHKESQPLGTVTISGGVATFPQDGDTVNALIAVADRRLYEAKNRGRNKVLLSAL